MYTEIDVADTKRKHGSDILTSTYSRNIKTARAHINKCTCELVHIVFSTMPVQLLHVFCDLLPTSG